MPEKDPVQETVSTLKSDQSLKTTLGEDTELRIPICHKGTCKAFLMHVSTALDAIEKWGTFKAYKQAHEAYVEQKEAAKEAKVNMNLFATAASKGKKATKKGTEKALKEASGKNSSKKEEASQMNKEGEVSTNATAPELHNKYKVIYKKAICVKETTKIQKDAAATKMFPFYANLLSLDAK